MDSLELEESCLMSASYCKTQMKPDCNLMSRESILKYWQLFKTTPSHLITLSSHRTPKLFLLNVFIYAFVQEK